MEQGVTMVSLAAWDGHMTCDSGRLLKKNELLKGPYSAMHRQRRANLQGYCSDSRTVFVDCVRHLERHRTGNDPVFQNVNGGTSPLSDLPAHA
jgi:hypothetical protein